MIVSLRFFRAFKQMSVSAPFKRSIYSAFDHWWIAGKLH